MGKLLKFRADRSECLRPSSNVGSVVAFKRPADAVRVHLLEEIRKPRPSRKTVDRLYDELSSVERA